mmetsp:Transcript_9706/g.8550  ORF Transcript_9706/g.8550 Transcript_9706/m.8550 type:complete len:86 (+) Transcript_9706:417-674(+)
MNLFMKENLYQSHCQIKNESEFVNNPCGMLPTTLNNAYQTSCNIPLARNVNPLVDYKENAHLNPATLKYNYTQLPNIKEVKEKSA